MSFEADEVRELVESLYGAIDRRDWSRLEALVSPRVVVEVASSAPMGWDAWLAHLTELAEAFPDGRHVIEEILVDGSHGISRCRFVATHRRDFRGIAATGAEVSVAGIHLDRFQGDMLVAHRGQLDMHGLLQQIADG
ncbi:ester cyclase [Mycolicibacterium pulveris]|uniref:ester cyclase n=1 Tax=Mycolicibacterium pulveris TaxID=36813 RepID=UPI003CF00446